MKRSKVMTTPKKEAMGPACSICGTNNPTREHVARHFNQELNEMIAELPNQTVCPECDPPQEHKNLGIHIALVHGRLDILLQNQDLVLAKRAKYASKPIKVKLEEGRNTISVTARTPNRGVSLKSWTLKPVK